MRQGITGALLLLVLLAGVPAAQAQVGSFSYQGSLKDATSPADGSYDFQFRIFPALTGGVAHWQTSMPAVTVSGGLFTVVLGADSLSPFPPGLFNGSPRFLEIAVKPAGSPNPHTVLSPRQELTATPTALFSSTTGDPTVQRRSADPSCPVGEYLRALAADGTPTCAPDSTGLTGTVGVANGGTGATTAAGARAGLSAAESGVNADITSLTGLTTALAVSQGGTGSATQNFVDLATTQTVGGSKTFVSDVGINGTLSAVVVKQGNNTVCDVSGNCGLGVPIVPIANGGTGSSTQNFVDLTTAQTVGGTKTFSAPIVGSVTGGAASATTVAGLACTNDQVLKWSGSVWTCGADTNSLVYDAGSGALLAGAKTVIGQGTTGAAGIVAVNLTPPAAFGTSSYVCAVTPEGPPVSPAPAVTYTSGTQFSVEISANKPFRFICIGL